MKAIEAVTAKKIHTPDLGGEATTEIVTSAVCDALWQDHGRRDAIERHVLAPIRVRLERERAEKREQAAATRVDFFTLVRGED